MTTRLTIGGAPRVRRGLTWLLAALTWATLVAAATTAPSQETRPNLILFIVDDLGWQDTSVALGDASLFQQHFQTPAVARLAATGVRFRQAYSYAVCSPTRVSIVTGLNAARHGVTNWILHPDRETSGVTPRLEAPRGWRREGLDPAWSTLPRLLRARGYTTIFCGKAHWGATGCDASDPLQVGFDVNIGGHAAGSPGSYQGIDDYDQRRADGLPTVWAVPGLEKYHGTPTHLTDALAREASAALEEAHRRGQPFFLMMAPYAVHVPIQPHGRFVERYRGKTFPGTDVAIDEREANYASMVEGVDAALGTLLQRLDELEIADRTLVLFTSDNGGLSAHARGTTPYGTGANTHVRPLREGKGSAYEGGTRVPLVVSWARRNDEAACQKALPIPAGAACDEPVICEDLFPTLAARAGLAAGEWQTVCDGVDWTPALLGQAMPERPLLFHYPHVWSGHAGGYQPHTALRLGAWKAIYFYQPRRWELYDLDGDPGETRDRSAEEPARLADLAHTLQRLLEERGGLAPCVRGGEPDPLRLPATAAACVPCPSREDRAAAAGWLSGGDWMTQHEDCNRIAREGQPQVVLLGDSITQSWKGPGRNVADGAGGLWVDFFGNLNAANFGISGDRTQHLLWRLDHGNLDGVPPAMFVVLIGTNNLADDRPEEIAEGIELIVRRLESRSPSSRILLLGILPRGNPEDPLRAKLNDVNRRIARLAGGDTAEFLDLTDRFTADDGRLIAERFASDQLHLSVEGYRVWGEAIAEPIRRAVDGAANRR